jgi:hypothetical protein
LTCIFLDAIIIKIIKKMKLKNLLICINNSVGTQMFKNYFVEKNEEEPKDVMQNGDLSCAYYVSTILLMFGLIDRCHWRVDGTIKAMENHGWIQIKKIRPGCVIIWDPIKQNGEAHFHIGFYIGEEIAVSNRSSMSMPGAHPLHYSGLDKENHKQKAKIHALYWHPDLG